MAINLGSGAISKLYLGATEIQKAYLGSTLVYDAGGGAFDPDYQAVLDFATSQGYALPSAGQQILQNQLVLDLKAAGIWSVLDYFKVYASDGDIDFVTINWKNPTAFQSTRVNSPTFIPNVGFTGTADGLSYINTNYNPAVNAINLTAISAHIASWSVEYAWTQTSVLCGANVGANAFGINRRGAGFDKVFNTSGFNNRPTSNDLKINDRYNATNVAVVDAGVVVDDQARIFAGIVNADVYELATTNNVLNFYDESALSIVSIGGSVYANRVAYRTALTNYITAL